MSFTTGTNFTIASNFFTTGNNFVFSYDTNILSGGITLLGSLVNISSSEGSQIPGGILSLQGSPINTTNAELVGFLTSEYKRTYSDPLDPKIIQYITDDINIISAPNWPGSKGKASEASFSPLNHNEPIILQTWVPNGWLAQFYYYDYYFRIHIFPNPLDVGLIINTTNKTFEVWNAFLVNETLNTVTESGTSGLTISSSATPPTIYKPLESRIYSILSNISGPPLIKAFYTFNFTDDTNTIAITGSRVLPIPFVPLAAFNETREWLTDVIETRGTESRLQIREKHREIRTYTYKFKNQQEFSFAKTLTNYAGIYMLGVPVWDNAVRIGSLASGTSIINFNTTEKEYTVDFPIVIWQNFDYYETILVKAITNSSITLYSATTKAYSNCFVMPLSYGFAENGFEFTRQAGKTPQMKTEYLIFDTYENPIWPSPQETFLALPVITDKHVAIGGINEKLKRDVEIFDARTGFFARREKELTTKFQQVLTFLARTKSEKYKIKRHIDWFKGRYNTFWFPTANDDLVAVGNVTPLTDFLRIKYAGWQKYGFKNVRITANEGVFNLNVTQVLPDTDPAQEILRFSSAITAGLSGIKKIEVLTKCRFETDSIEFNHINKDLLTISVHIIEVNP